VSFDIFLQDFAETPEDRSSEVLQVLSPLMQESGQQITTSDGEADVYGASDLPLTGLMFTHIAGEAAWDVIFQVALAAGWVVMPVGFPVLVPEARLVDSIPAELRDMGIDVVGSGADILRIVLNH